MDFSLSSSLIGNAVSNPDKPALDLQFATDKTLTARKGPTPVFTRASSATFVNSNGLIQSAVSNAARFDHDPITLACKGLLIEESRTNNCYNSNLLTSASWTPAGCTVALDAAGPDGTTAFEVSETAVTSIHSISNSGGATGTLAFNGVGGSIYTLSLFAKKSTGSIDWVQLTGTGSIFGTIQYANFNIATGVIGNYANVTAGTIPKIEQFPNGWYRCSITLTAAATATGNALNCNFTNNTNGTTRAPSYLGSAANKVLLAMGQVELGAFPTSYIPNVATTGAIRSADVCSISGSAFTEFWNQTSGTLLEVFEASPNTNTTYVSASNGNIAQNSIHFDNDTGNMRAVYYSGSAIVATLSLGSVGIVGAVNKIASAYSVNDFSASRNGGTVVVDSSGAVPASLSQINIGTDERSQTPVSFYSNRCIGSLRYYKKRLSNAKLQTLTV